MKRLEPLLVLPCLAGLACLLASAGAVLEPAPARSMGRPATLVRPVELSERPAAWPEELPGGPRRVRGVRARSRAS